MNQVHVDIKRIEVVVTHSCSGKCKHCSAATTYDAVGGSVNANAVVNTIKRLTDKYAVESIMTFGGEPLLFADTVCKIHSVARDSGIPVRQIITNGFFSRDEQKMDEVAEMLCVSGVNNILLSVDAFHQEHIPIEPVVCFAKSLLKHNTAKFRVHPAWLVNEQHENPYNDETKRLLKIFNGMEIETSSGNNIFPAGNALKYLSDYFPSPKAIDLSVPCGQMPYTSRLDEVGCVSISPNGDLEQCSFVIGNIYREDILFIPDGYDPYKMPAARALMEDGAKALLRYTESLGITIDTSDCYSACGVCRKIMAALKERGVE